LAQDLSTASDYSIKIKDGFKSVFNYALETQMAQMPLFRIPVLGSMLKKIIFDLVGEVFEYSRLKIFFSFIDMRSIDQKGVYIKSIDKWNKSLKTGDKNEIKKAMVEMFNHIDDFFKFNRI
jgi:hypothetical protein